MRHARGLMLVLLVSCTNEVTVASNTCGNYVLEPGEDCDQPGDACTKDCRLACSAMVACPDTMACGTDQICHAGTGRFHTSPITHAFNATSFVLTDLDEDGAHDALGVTSGSVAVGHGGADPFATSEQLAAPFSTGASSLGDFTGDGKADVLIPTAGGVAGFETSSGTAQPAVFPFAVAAPGTIHVRAATTSTGGLVSLDFQNGNVPGAQLSLDGGAATYPCAALFGQPKGRSLHPYVDGARVRVPMILSGALEQSMPTKTVPAGICIDSPGAASGSQRIAYSGIGNTIAAGEAFFAQVPGSGACPALIAPVTVTLLGEGALVIPGAGVPGGCTVATPVLVGPSQNSVFVPGAPLAAIRLDIAGGPQIGIITAKGVSTVDLTSKTHVVVSQATRAWTYAAVTDLDGDGHQDFIAAATAEDLEVFMQLPSQSQTAQWRASVIPTSAAVDLFDIGDLDGDGATDVALGILDGTDTHTGEVEVAFGQPPGAFTTPLTVATVPELDYLVVENVVDPSLPVGFDHTDDILLAHGGDDLTTEHAELTYLYGSGSRTLFSPWVASFPAFPQYTYGAGVVSGHFGPGGTTGAVAIFRNPTDSPTSTGNALQVLPVVLTYDATGTFDATLPQGTSSSCGGAGSFCAATAKYAVWPRSTAAGGDMLIALRSDKPAGAMNPECGAYYTAQLGTITALPCTAMFEQGAFYDAHAANLVGIQSVRVFAHTDDTATVAINALNGAKFSTLVFTVTLVNGSPQFHDGIDVSAEVGTFAGATVYCVDSTSIELGSRTANGVTYGDGAKEIVTACAGTLYARFAAADPTSAPYYEKLGDTPLDERATLRSGDVDGDGLDDLVYLTGLSGETTLSTRLQCDTHDSGCADNGGAQ